MNYSCAEVSTKRLGELCVVFQTPLRPNKIRFLRKSIDTMKNLRSVSFCVSKRPLTHIEVAKAAGLLDLSNVGHICTSTLITSSTENVNFDEEVERTIEREAYELFKPSLSQSFSNWLRLADPDESDRTPSSDRSLDLYPEPLYYAQSLTGAD